MLTAEEAEMEQLRETVRGLCSDSCLGEVFGVYGDGKGDWPRAGQ